MKSVDMTLIHGVSLRYGKVVPAIKNDKVWLHIWRKVNDRTFFLNNLKRYYDEIGEKASHDANTGSSLVSNL